MSPAPAAATPPAAAPSAPAVSGAPPAPGDALQAAEPGARGHPTAWWGMVILIMTEATLFGGLLSSYFFLRALNPTWPLGGIKPPDLGRISVFTAVLLGSSVPVFWAEAGIKRGKVGRLRAGLALSWVMGLAFFVNQVLEYRSLGFGPRTNAYGSLFYAITGLHGAHVALGLIISLVVQLKAWLGRLSARRHLTAQVFGLYWHFVDGVWVFVFSSLYLAAHVR
ncbi:MAG TPA: cytochrome c oxidase subunit 3 [Acidimicrobiales bacterium]|nr:cytochrome c oxidase subunit 3 [Acidimicrobiales bacterium]